MRATPITLACLAVLAPLAAAQGGLVVPNSYVGMEGVTENSWPFRYTLGAGRYQQSYDARHFGGPISIAGIGFRYKFDPPHAGAAVDFALTLSYCARPWNALGASFAANIGASPLLVHDGPLTIAPYSGSAASPEPFSFFVPFRTPFDYDPSGGDLLIDIAMRSSAFPSNAGAFDRAGMDSGVQRVYENSASPAGTSGTVDGVGLITVFLPARCRGRVRRAGSGCADLSATAVRTSWAGCPDLGAILELGILTGPADHTPFYLSVGSSGSTWSGLTLPFDLGPYGAPGCSISVAPELFLGPIANPGGGARWPFTIDADPALIGLHLAVQGVLFEPAANPLGLVTSDYLEIDIR